MNCSAARELLHQSLAGEPLSPELCAHLEACSSCQEFDSETRGFDDRLRAAVAAESLSTASLERRVMSQIGEEGRHARRRVWGWAIAASLATAGIISAVAGWHSVQPSPLLAAAARDHVVEVVNHQPRRWRVDMASAIELGAMPEAPAALIPLVAKAGYTFKEAKICRLGGLPFLHVVYTDGKEDFSLFLRRGEGGTVTGQKHDFAHGKCIFTSDRNAQHIAGFTSGDLKAVVVTSEGGGSALSIARAASQVL